jgi:hypothetical protein
MNNEIRREACLRLNRLGNDEFRLALSRAINKDDVNEIVQLVEAFRSPFAEGKAANLGSIIAATPEAWQAVANEADAAARAELLQDSSEFNALQKLEKAANEARKLAEAKHAELSRDWDKYSATPEQLDMTNTRLARINSELESLDAQVLETEFKGHYKSLLNGSVASAGFLDAVSIKPLTVSLRREVLEKLQQELETEATGLKARQKQLAKRLGRKE